MTCVGCKHARVAFTAGSRTRLDLADMDGCYGCGGTVTDDKWGVPSWSGLGLDGITARMTGPEQRMVEGVYEARVMRLMDIGAIAYRGRRPERRRMAQLTSERVLRRSDATWGREVLYTLGGQGVRLARQRQGLRDSEASWRAVLPGPAMVGHQLVVGECVVHWLAAEGDVHAGLGGCLRQGSGHVNVLAGQGKRYIPDYVMRAQGGQLLVLGEVDMGSERLTQLRSKWHKLRGVLVENWPRFEQCGVGQVRLEVVCRARGSRQEAGPKRISTVQTAILEGLGGLTAGHRGGSPLVQVVVTGSLPPRN